MMSFFTTLKKNPATSTYAAPAVSHAASCTNLVQESTVALHRLVPHPVLPPSVRDPSHVYARSPRGLTRGFLHQPCARIYSRIASTCPSSGPATFCEGSQPRPRTQPPRPRTQLSLHQPVQFSLHLSRDICYDCTPTVLGGDSGSEVPN